MAHFAEINEDGVVLRVIVAEQPFIDSGAVGDPSRWIQTSYNTHAGEHALGGIPLRKNYAGIGYKYDQKLDAFIPPKPAESWVLNEETCLWEPPKKRPTRLDTTLQWDEASLDWKQTYAKR
jgi:hypothetical protein